MKFSRRHLLAVPGMLVAKGNSAPRIVIPAPENESSVIATAGGRLRLYYMVRDRHVASISSDDGGQTWSAARVEFPTTGPTAHACVALHDRAGTRHVFFLGLRGDGRRPAIDRFIDIWHTRSASGGAAWHRPRVIYKGYIGSLRSCIQLRNGRIVLPFALWQADRLPGPPFGSNEVTSLCSDDNGHNWMLSTSRLRSPCREGYNGSNYGAVEPCIVQMADGRVWMLMRTQTGHLYESFSEDGSRWQESRPSRFRSSNSPAALLRLRSGALMVFWNNCLPPPRHQGQGVYGGREALHAAVSFDGGESWRGLREIYLDPTRNESPPRTGDRATAYPCAAEAPDGHVVVTTGQGEGRCAVVRFHPDWLLESQRSDSFLQGLGRWSVFESVGPASGYWRDRRPAARLIRSTGRRALSIFAGAVWNFPSARRGQLEVVLCRGTRGGTLSLTDSFFDPDDVSGDSDAPFSWDLASHGLPQEDSDVRAVVDWDGNAGVMRIGSNDFRMAARRSAPHGLSYLRLRSAPADADSVGLVISSVDVRRL
jgi:hypothetical protein